MNFSTAKYAHIFILRKYLRIYFYSFMPNIGQKLKSHREKMGLTQAQMADNLTIGLRTYQSIEETGEIKKIKYQKAIDAALGSTTQKNASDDDGETLKEILKVQVRTMEAILKIMDRQDRRSEKMESNLVRALETVRTIAVRQEADEEIVLKSLARLEKIPETQLFADAGKRKSQIERAARKPDKADASR